MRRSSLGLLVSVPLVLSLSGCGDDDSQPGNDRGNDSNTTTSVETFDGEPHAPDSGPLAPQNDPTE